jgi:transcriptional regulator with XRE-family HTH domain
MRPSRLADRIRELRYTDWRAWSERELAQRAGLSIGALRDLGTGLANPTLRTMVALARAFDLRSIEELIGPMPIFPTMQTAARTGRVAGPPSGQA